MSAATLRTTKPGFSLIELLIVILIIALVIAIIVPALGGARTAARKVSTQALVSQVTNGVEQFAQDHGGAMPGYFSARDMGGLRNAPGNRGGFTAMENALLDLVAADAIVGEAGPGDSGGSSGANILGSVGPMGTAGGKTQPRNLKVDLDLIGIEGSYLEMDADSLKAAEGQEASKEHKAFPDIVDSFGNPLLAWVEDPMAPRIPASEAEFAAEDAQSASFARYYWNSNGAWLSAKAMGRDGRDQSSGLLADPTKAEMTLTAVLGNPNFPTPTDYDASDVLPGASRGGFVVHSAGADGVFISLKDNGARAIGVTGADDLEYARNFFTGQGGRWTDDKGLPSTIDLIQDFDDLIGSTSN
ncbi:MAG: prepilin-type N-terminal cleavage/methylation domain-containing protein [Phycisphaerales bacterium]|nr:prepilin-type N-terminal cleavage/methylation domain-containing protein [Phycisphaerales bacterium]